MRNETRSIRALPMRQPSQEPLSKSDDEPQPAIVAVPQPFRQRVRRADRARRAGHHPGVRPMKQDNGARDKGGHR